MRTAKSIAVFDLETSGFNDSVDRIVEISIVLLDPATLEVIDEFDTLVNPQRDFTQSSHIHGITASMVSAAPSFEDIAPRVAELLSGSILVAHNLSFDVRFLKAAFMRIGMEPDFGKGIDTLALTRMNLGQSCQTLGIALEDAHRALADARACASLLVTLSKASSVLVGQPAEFTGPAQQGSFRTLRREQVGASSSLKLQIPPIRFGLPAHEDAELTYLLVLDGYLSDGALTAEEKESLGRLVEVLALAEKVQILHEKYFANALAAASEDGEISPLEREYLGWLAESLNLDIASLELPAREVSNLGDFAFGLRICFTGTTAEQEKELYSLAMARGHVPVESLTKKGCDVLVCVDTSTMSSKAKNARKFGLLIVSIEQFLNDLGEA